MRGWEQEEYPSSFREEWPFKGRSWLVYAFIALIIGYIDFYMLCIEDVLGVLFVASMVVKDDDVAGLLLVGCC